MVAPRIGSNGSINGFMPPPLRFPVDVKATTNDPVMRIAVNGRTVSITGVANNRGTTASYARFEVAGQKIRIPLSGGTTGEKLLAALRYKLPVGLSTQGSPSSFQIMRGAVTPTPVKTTTEQIEAIFARAQQPGSPGKGLITTAELREMFKIALSTGGRISKEEKQIIAQSWASTFTGAGFLATPAAQKEYARLQQKYQLPIIPVH